MKTIINCCLALIVISLFACNSSNPISPVVNCWKTLSISKDGMDVKEVTSGDLLCLRADSSFNYFLQKEMIVASGQWELHDSTLTLNYDYLPGDTGLDSVRVSNSGLLEYFLNGKVVKRLGLSKSLTDGKRFNEIYQASRDINRVKRHYLVTQLSEDKLVFEENGVSFSYVKGEK